MCRADHEAKNRLEAETGESYYTVPSLEVMTHALTQLYRESGRNIPRSLRKAIKEYEVATDKDRLIQRAAEEIERQHAA